MKSLEELQDKIASYPTSDKVLPRSKRATVQLGEDLNYIDICVLSNIQIGLVGPHKNTAKFDKPFRIKKLQAHIEELAKNPNSKVLLGGDLFYFPGGGEKYRELYSPSYREQIELMCELLKPIKDKIIGAYDGTEEAKIKCAELFFSMLEQDGYKVYFKTQINNRQMKLDIEFSLCYYIVWSFKRF